MLLKWWKYGEADSQEEAPAIFQKFAYEVSEQAHWDVRCEELVDPGLEEIKVGNIVLSEGRCDFREMFFNQLVKDLAVES